MQPRCLVRRQWKQMWMIFGHFESGDGALTLATQEQGVGILVVVGDHDCGTDVQHHRVGQSQVGGLVQHDLAFGTGAEACDQEVGAV